MIKINNICKSYGELTVLKDISLEIQGGEIVSIVGPSGAGKTTLLQIIGTLSKPDSGDVYLNNSLITGFKEKQLSKFRNKNIGFVFQFHHLLPEFTALENVMLPGIIGNKNKSKTKKAAQELLKTLGLESRVNHKPDELSGGEQQRVAVARALINDPEVILADEPSGNLDTKNKKELHELFFSLRDRFNQTFVIVTHDMELADMSDRVIKMKDGKLE